MSSSTAARNPSIERLYKALKLYFPMDRYARAIPTGEVSSKGKVQLRAVTYVEQPFTVKHLEDHLHGRALHGLYLNTREGFAKSLAIDIDTYGEEATAMWARVPAMLERAARHGWTLHPIRSKSGGVQLWAYFAADVPYVVLDARTRELVTLLGLPKETERFPKTPTLPGSQVWLPYFGDSR